MYGLPHAGGLGFAGLDEYLAHLKRLEPLDVPSYTEVDPGIYRFDSHAPHDPTAHRRFTREELERRFGFDAAAQPGGSRR